MVKSITTSKTPQRKTQREEIADERYKRWMEALGQAEANRSVDGLWPVNITES